MKEQDGITQVLIQEAYWSALARNLQGKTHRYKKYQSELDALLDDATRNVEVWHSQFRQLPPYAITEQLRDVRSRAAYQAAKDADRARVSKSPYRALDHEYVHA